MLKKGFSLVEILIAVTIMAIVAGGAMVLYTNYEKQARRKTTVTSLRTVKGAIEAYHSDASKYPGKLQDLVTKPKDVDAEDWMQHFSKVPVDAWKQPFRYKLTKDGYELWSVPPKAKSQAEWIRSK